MYMNNCNTQSVRGRIALSKLCAIIALVSWSAAMMPSTQATVITLTGGDPGEGYAPLTNTIYAYHFVNNANLFGPGLTDTIQNVSFLPFNVQSASAVTVGGNTLSGNGPVYGGGAANIGSNPSDLALQDMGKNLAYGSTHTSMSLVLRGLQDGHDYQLDLFRQYPAATVPATYVITGGNGTFVENVPGVGGTYYDVRNIVYSSGGQIVISITNGPAAIDTPYINAFSITEVPEPTATLLASLGAMLVVIHRRRGRA